VENNEHIQQVIDFREALHSIFNSESGKTVIKFLESAYVESSALHENQATCMYRLGQKEVIQGLLKDAQEDPKNWRKSQ